FSGRRRQTRSKRDWSSEVCSSDLFAYLNYAKRLAAGREPIKRLEKQFISVLATPMMEEVSVGLSHVIYQPILRWKCLKFVVSFFIPFMPESVKSDVHLITSLIYRRAEHTR